MIFGLITEGPTDQVVLEVILSRFYNDPNIDVRPVQPNNDATDGGQQEGGWSRVFEYCASPNMQKALQSFDYTIIQLDTDVCEDFGIVKRENGNDLTPEQIVEKATQKIIDSIPVEIYNFHKDKIIYAICHESLECWFLPLYFTNNKRAKTMNCCNTLNQELQKEGFTIDCGSKNTKYHQRICKKIRSKSDVTNMATHQLSLKRFLNLLPE